jgi:hypothetical protein
MRAANVDETLALLRAGWTNNRMVKTEKTKGGRVVAGSHIYRGMGGSGFVGGGPAKVRWMF